jgi:O-antigen/teichoic acid export membrane protein
MFKLGLKKILKIVGIDFAIFYTISARVLQATGSLVNIFLISHFLSKEEQGYYYTFGSIVGIQIFFELGLNTILIQFVAHEKAHVSLNSNNEFIGKPENLSRLSSLLRFCISIFSKLSIVLFFVLNIIGYLFFTKFSKNDSNINWHFPWVLLCFSTSLMLCIDPIMGFFQGLGQVKDTAKVFLFQQVATLITSILILLNGGGLWTLGLSNLISAVTLIYFLSFTYRNKILKFIYNKIGEWKVDYKKEIFPYQWRIALSWISGYFIFQLFNPVLFATEGAVVAGQMGMSISAFNGVSAISMSWITTKVPLFSEMIARKEFDKLDSTFNFTIKNLIIVCLILLSTLLIFIYLLTRFHFALANRFLPIPYLIILSIITLINQLIFSWATFLRCHKKEPFLINSIVGGITCAMSTIILGHYFGLNGIVLGYLTLTLLSGLPWGYTIFKTKKLEYRKAN